MVMRKVLPVCLVAMALASAVARAADTAVVSPAAAAALVRTPKAPETPRINGARVFGAHPGNPFFFHIPATGVRPITIVAEGLPDGLKLDGATGNITGVATAKGSHPVKLTATNVKGSATAMLNIIIGDTICLTPPMGWNSWNHFHRNVSDKVIRDTADTMAATGLIDHGWTYVNIDDCWEGKRDAEGRIQGNEKFPDLKALGDYVHSKGLKFGIYSSPGPKTCAGFEATYEHEDQDAQSYAQWGVDYVKYDWCSYGQIAKKISADKFAALVPGQADEIRTLMAERNKLEGNRKRTAEQEQQLKEVRGKINSALKVITPEQKSQVDLEILQHPYKQFRESLDKVQRDIVFSYCQYGMGNSWEWAGALGGNCWRTTGDISASWKSMTGIGFAQNGHEKYASPGHWNDPDMLEIGNKGLTPDECYTHMTLWCLLASPLLIGCDMTQMDAVTVDIFSNDEVIGVNQDALGKQGYRVAQQGDSEVWAKPLADGTLAVGLFNRSTQPATVSIRWADLKLQGPQAVRDLWRQKDTGPQESELSCPVAPHSAELFRVGTPHTAP